MVAYVSRFGGAIPFSGIASGTYAVKISGVQYLCIAGSLKIDLSVGRRSQASFQLYTSNTVHFQQYQTVTIFDANGTLVFSGYITIPKEQKPGFQKSLLHTITAIDQHFLADKRIIAKIYTGMTCGAIVQDIVANYLAEEGVTLATIFDGLIPNTTLYPSSTLYPNGNVGVIPTVAFSYCTIAAALDALVTEASTAGIPYYWMIDQNKKLYFVPYTAIVSGTIVNGQFVDQVTYPATVQRQNPKYRNIEYLTGGTAQTKQQAETKIGDGNTTSWTMGYPLFSAPTISVQTAGLGNAVYQNVGLKGTSGSQYYWAYGDPVITQDNSISALTNQQTLYVTYVGQYPSVVVIQNPTQITAQRAIDGTSGKIEVVDEDTALVDLPSAFIEASRFLTRYGVSGTVFQFSSMINAGFTPGQLVLVDLPDHAINQQQMLIETVSIADLDSMNIWYTVSCVLGPYDTTWVSFFSQLLVSKQPASAISVGTNTTTPPVVTAVTPTIANFVASLVSAKASLTATLSSGASVTSQSFTASIKPVAALTATLVASGSGVSQSFTASIKAPSATFTATATASGGTGTGKYPTFSGPASACSTIVQSYSTTSDQAIRFFKFSDNCNTSDLSTSSFIYGTNLLVYWSELEPTEGNYNWSYLDGLIKPWSDNGKKVIPRVSVCGQAGWTSACSTHPSAKGTPQWVFDAGVKSYVVKGATVPAYWDSTFTTKYKNFIAAFGNRYNGNSVIEFVQAGTGMGGEAKPDTTRKTYPTLDTTLQADLKSIGFDNDKWWSYLGAIADAYKAAFPHTKLATQTAYSYISAFGGTKHREGDYVALLAGKGFGLQNDGINKDVTQGSNTVYTLPDPAWKAGAFISCEQRNPTSQTGNNFECDVEAQIAYCQNSKPIYSLIFHSDIGVAANQTILKKYGSIN